MIDPEMKLTEHFKLGEFLCPCCKTIPEGLINNLRSVADALEWARELHKNRPVIITSGYRCWNHHVEIYKKALGKKFNINKVPRNSYHLSGKAADFVVKGVAPSVTQEILKDWNGGLELAPTWTHLDLGNKRRFRP